MSLVPLSRLFPAGRPSGAAMIERDGARLSFAQLAVDVSGTAARLERRAVRRALLVAEDGYWFLVGMLALLQVDAEIVMPPNAQPGTLSGLLQQGDVLVTDQLPTSLDQLALAPHGDGEARALRPLDPERCRFSFFTSGSTGERKRIAKTLAQLETEVRTLESLWGGLLGDAGVLGTVSHQHIFGLTFRLLWPVMAGRLVAARLHFTWESLLAALAKPEMLVVSPAHLSRLDGLAPLAPAIRPRAIFTAGAPLSPAAARDAAALLGDFAIEIFGSTETGAIAWRQQAEAGVAWRPLPGMDVTADGEGTLQLRSPFLAPGEIYRSADRIALAEGGFHFQGRSDRVVKIEGKRVGLSEVERDLAALPWVREAAVVALSERRSFLAAAIVLSQAGRDALAEHGKFRFERRLRQTLGVTQDWAGLPRRWRFLDALPRDAMGKCPAAAVEALFAGGDGDHPVMAPAPTEPDIVGIRAALPHRCELDLVVPADLVYFSGHFDGFPVLPGVVQLHWSLQLARRYLPLGSGVPATIQVKFREPIRPGTQLVLTLTREVAGGREQLAFDYRRDGAPCSSGRIVLTDP